MLFNQPNAKKNPTRPWERKKITLFDRLEALVKKRKPSKVTIAIAAVKTIRDIRKTKKNKKGARRGR